MVFFSGRFSHELWGFIHNDVIQPQLKRTYKLCSSLGLWIAWCTIKMNVAPVLGQCVTGPLGLYPYDINRFIKVMNYKGIRT
jgi:hypothetical protein